MFSLIISIIAIALVIVLAGASLYYGGDAFNKGTAKGEAAKLVNEAQQLQAAYTMYKVDNAGAEPADLATFAATTAGYLSVDLEAQGWALNVGADGVVITVDSADVCTEVDGINSQVTCAAGSLNYSF
jgi:hypothetical protein